jgi:hypothetical protein
VVQRDRSTARALRLEEYAVVTESTSLDSRNAADTRLVALGSTEPQRRPRVAPPLALLRRRQRADRREELIGRERLRQVHHIRWHARNGSPPDVEHRQTGVDLADGTTERRRIPAGPLGFEHLQSTIRQHSAQLLCGPSIVSLVHTIATPPQQASDRLQQGVVVADNDAGRPW